MTDIEALRWTFRELFGGDPEFVVRAPGRVNLIGEHTDYNDGYVLPAAIDRDVAIAGSPRSDRQVRLYSSVFGQSSTFSLDSITHSEDARWTNYARGVATILQGARYRLTGMNAVVSGDVPLSSGLSSSAAMEVAFCLAFECAAGLCIEPVRRALLSQRAEREFVGVQCGIMDQLISALGEADHALFIDTRTLEHRSVPMPSEGVSLIIGNTNKPRELVTSAYNTRRAECEGAVAFLKEFLPGIRALRDVSEADLAECGHGMPKEQLKRARHIVTENARVLASMDAMAAGDLPELGRLMNASHDSLRDDYEVSCAELDTMVDAARATPGVLGSRMTGAGFGGCTVSLVRNECVAAFVDCVGSAYRLKTGLDPAFYVCRASDGARRIG